MQLFCNVDENGEITDVYSGVNIIAIEPFDFFFLVDAEVAENIGEYRVVIEGYKPRLERKDGDMDGS